MKIGLFFGSSGGNTEKAAQLIEQELTAVQSQASITVVNVMNGGLEQMTGYDKLILGSPTTDDGELQEDWADVFEQMDALGLSGKQVAVFGLGDQVEYPTSFQDAIGMLARKARERGATLVGFWPTEGYTFEKSGGVENGAFMGLSLDFDNQSDLTAERVKSWVRQIAGEFGVL